MSGPHHRPSPLLSVLWGPTRPHLSARLCICGYLLIFVYLSSVFPMSTTGPTFSPQTQNDSSPSGAGRLYTNQYIWTADFITQKKRERPVYSSNSAPSQLSWLESWGELLLATPWLFLQYMSQKDSWVQHVSHLKPLPTTHISGLKQYAHRSSASFGGIGWPLEHILKRPQSLSACLPMSNEMRAPEQQWIRNTGKRVYIHVYIHMIIYWKSVCMLFPRSL